MTTLLSALVLSVWQTALQEASTLHLPEPIAKCLQSEALQVRARLVETRNPYYLRGDFDADGRADYVIVVHVFETAKDALLICSAVGRPVLLGGRAEPKQAFSSVASDKFIAPSWEVLNPAEVRRLTSFSSNVPKPVRNQRGDAIAMVFEDAVELVYWNGRQYLHAPARF